MRAANDLIHRRGTQRRQIFAERVRKHDPNGALRDGVTPKNLLDLDQKRHYKNRWQGRNAGRVRANGAKKQANQREKPGKPDLKYR